MKKLVFFLLLLVVSCKVDLKQADFKVETPSILSGYYDGRDTVFSSSKDESKTLLFYYSNSTCPSCDVSHTVLYREYIDYALKNPDKLNVQFLYAVKDSAVVEDIRIYTIMYPVDVPIYVDWGGTFIKNNPKLPTNHHLLTLLLDSKDSILLSDIYVKDGKSAKLFIKQLDDFVFNQ